ncbi:MAG: hypothetical protein ACXV3F_13395 [Frankiaceae bacterium]
MTPYADETGGADGSGGRVVSEQSEPLGERGKRGSWLGVILIIAAFIVGLIGLIETNWVVGVVGGVLLVIGGITALASNIMEQVEG